MPTYRGPNEYKAISTVFSVSQNETQQSLSLCCLKFWQLEGHKNRIENTIKPKLIQEDMDNRKLGPRKSSRQNSRKKRVRL